MTDKIPGADKKVVAGILGILLGALGIHRFYLGDTTGGILRIVITVITCGFGSIIGLIEGIIYLVKSDEEFVELYINQKKGWF
jgi:TM2 domain-containing membrane protein YozV